MCFALNRRADSSTAWRTSIMNDEPETQSPAGVKAAHKAKAQRPDALPFWFGVGKMALLGWSVAMPVLVGAGLGLWLDADYPASHSWMRLLMPLGLALGCFNAWRSVSRRRRKIRDPEKLEDE